MKKIKLLIVATTKFDADGITNVILNYYRAMDKSDMQIDFIVPNKIRAEIENEIKTNNGNIFVVNDRVKNPIKYMKSIYKIMKTNNYNIIHSHGNSCTLALEMVSAKFAGIQVRIAHSHNSTCKHIFAHVILRPLFNLTYTYAFACGEKAGHWLFKKKSFEIINNGIELNKFQFNVNVRQKYRDDLKINDNIVIGHIGHFTFQKNHDFIIEVFKELFRIDKKYVLMLIGDGDNRDVIENKVKSYGLTDNVIFTGKSYEVPQLMQAIDIILMPSRFEGLPLTLIEAQAACLTCYVSDVITKEVEITDLVKFISLDETPQNWARRIHSQIEINRKEIANRISYTISSRGYSINENAIKLKDKYLNQL